MIHSARSLLVAAAIVLATTTLAAAQPAPPDATALEASGNKHYELAEYAAAIADFKEAFRITDTPELLFNIAQASRLSGDCRQALTFYRTYLRRLPSAPNAAKVRDRITEMEACAAAQPATPATTPATSATPPEATPLPPPPPARVHVRTWKTWAGLGAVGAGALGAGLGAMFAIRGGNKADQLRDACATSCTSDDALAIEADGRAANRNAVIGFVAGGALVAAGVVLIVLDRRTTREVAPSGAQVAVSGDGAIAGWAWQF